MSGYAARNAILPSISGFAVSIGLVVGGSLLTEMVFNYPTLAECYKYAAYDALGHLRAPEANAHASKP